MSYSWNDSNEPDVRYVLIGNGFDLECDLHTSYKSFLSFVREEKHGDIHPHADSLRLEEWEDLRSRNFWFKRFESVQIGNGWVDFENEMARVIETIERSMERPNGTLAFIDDDVKWDLMYDKHPLLADVFNVLSDVDGNVRTYRDLAKRLLNDLSSLTRGLEAYLYDFECTHAPKETGVTKGLVGILEKSTRAYVISFNYTPTLESMLRHRGIDEFCYVHGTIGDGSKKNSMVLGIDEYRKQDEASAPVEFGPFRKYNQRIYKQTDSGYMNWLNDVRLPYERYRQITEAENQILLSPSNSFDLMETRKNIIRLKGECEQRMRNREVIVFGHSLGITDKDILRSFITLPDTRTVVYHHDEEAFSDQVSNMTAILGMDEVIARTGGKGRTLEFKHQSELAC